MTFMKCVAEIQITGAKCSADEVRVAGRMIGIILQYYSSIYNQKTLGSLSEETWTIRAKIFAFSSRMALSSRFGVNSCRKGFVLNSLRQ